MGCIWLVQAHISVLVQGQVLILNPNSGHLYEMYSPCITTLEAIKYNCYLFN